MPKMHVREVRTDDGLVDHFMVWCNSCGNLERMKNIQHAPGWEFTHICSCGEEHFPDEF